MEICSIGFLLALCGIIVAFHLLPSARLRRYFLGLVNCLFLIPLVPNTQSWIWILVFLGGTYSALVLVRARPRRAIVCTGIVLVVAVFAYVKRYSFIPSVVPVELWFSAWGQHQYVVVVGLSYMLFKFIQMLVDEWQGQLAPFTFLSYLNFQLAFFTLIAGPIQRYNDFKRGWDEMDLQPSEARETWLAWNRVLTGMIKMRVLAPVVLYASNQASNRMNPSDPNHAWYSLLVFYAYPIQLYFNFSGYTDTAIGSARLLGFKLPENFNRPYLARNVLDFWNRWHMSLTHWIRDYVFMTSYKAAATQYPRWARWWSYGLLFVALFITGIWHGSTSGFVVFGVLNGIGAAVNRAYGDVLKAVLGRSGVERYLGSRLIRCLAIATTFHYVCFCHLAFSSGVTMSAWIVFTDAVQQVMQIVQGLARFHWTAVGLAVPVAVSLLLAGLWNADALGGIAARISAWLMRGTLRVPAVICIQIVVMTFLFFLDWTIEQEPPRVVYMRF
jgi:D-alanyl-lipoteichoic acid acyltransferase DltB (MBOAT superfamily)